MSRALSDEDASKEMKKMVAFIMQEANEKAKEIKIKADEEFNIEKAKLVRQETSSIEANFTRRLNQAVVKRKIAQSNQVNKSRLRLLQFRDEKLNEIVAEAEVLLTSLANNPADYSALISNLCLEVFYRFMEGEVTLRCLSRDLEVVEGAAGKAAGIFEQSTGLTLKYKIVSDLGEENYGGIIGSCKNGRISCSNTLKDRLAIVSEKSLPNMREILIGISKTRKFFN